MRAVPPAVRKTAEDACFHHLKGLNLSPLSKHALARARAVVVDLGRCIRRAGFPTGPPDVRNLGRGRAAFGFKPLPKATGLTRRDRQRYISASHRCERQVQFAQRLSKIIADDRKDTVGGNL